MTHRLVLRQAPSLRVDARLLSPAALAGLAPAGIAKLALPHGRDRVPLGEWFDVVPDPSAAEPAAGPRLRLEGDLGRFDALGAGLAEGTLEIHGSVGDAAGLGMTGGTLRIHGSARDLAGCAMSGGWLEIDGDARDFVASALPGDLDGMRGGTLVIRGRAGDRLADRMRRGTLVVFGDVGDFAASRLVAGTVALGGACGAHTAWGMRRGSIVFAQATPDPGSTFVPVDAEFAVFWQLLARDLARFGGPFETLARRSPRRFAGDLAVLGKGDLLLPAL